MKDLIKVARKLKGLGLVKEANALAVIIKKIAADRVKDLKEFDDGLIGDPYIGIDDSPYEYEYDENGLDPNDYSKPHYPRYLGEHPNEGPVWPPEGSDVPSDTADRLTEGPIPDVSPSQRTLMERLWSGGTRAIGRNEIASAATLEKRGLVMITDPGSQKWPKIWCGVELTEAGKKFIAPKEFNRRPTGGPRSHTMHSGLAEKE